MEPVPTPEFESRFSWQNGFGQPGHSFSPDQDAYMMHLIEAKGFDANDLLGSEMEELTALVLTKHPKPCQYDPRT